MAETSQRRLLSWPQWLNLCLLLGMAGLGWLGLGFLRTYAAHNELETVSIISIGVLGCWRWGWFGVHLIRARIYLAWQFPRWRRLAQRVVRFNWPALAIIVPTYKEEPAITERAFIALAQAAKQLPIPLTIVAITTPPEMIAIEAILRQQDPHFASLRLITLPQTEAGKRKALADGMRTLQTLAKERQIPNPEVVVLMDGDSVLGADTIRKCLPLFRVLPKVGAITTDEIPEVKGSHFFSEWMELRFAQRHLQMASQSLSRKLLCLTGRFSLFRAEIVLNSSFIERVEKDSVRDWLWGEFRFLSGDDKSTWFWVLQQGYEMIYVPDTQVISVETVSGNQWLRIYQNMRRWFGNMLRNSNRSLSLGPWRTGWFLWWCLIDQRLNCWTSLTTLGILFICLCLGDGLGIGLILSWILFSRPLSLLVLTWGRPFAVKPIHLLQLLLAQWSSALVKIYTQMHLAQQRWANRGNQQITAGGGLWQQRLKSGLARWFLLAQGLSFFLFLLWSLRLVNPTTAIAQLWQNQSPQPSQPPTVVVARNWGVIANDGQDDALALQQLIDRLPTQGAVQIQLPPGELHLQHSLKIHRSQTTLVGEGMRRTFLNLQPGKQLVITPRSNKIKSFKAVTLRGLTVVQQSGIALVIQRLRQGQLENLQFVGKGDYALTSLTSPGLRTDYVVVDGQYAIAPMQMIPVASKPFDLSPQVGSERGGRP